MPAYLTEQNLGNIFSTLLPDTPFIHNKTVPNSGVKMRPDFRFETLKLIVEFDGSQHYQDVNVLFRDKEKDRIYQAMGYRIVRIPYFIQMTQELLHILFQQEFSYQQCYPHGFIDDNAVLPANFCELGIMQFQADLGRFDIYRLDIISSLRKKITIKKEINLVLPPSLHDLID
ncbi:hypothetical protein NEIFL0001_0538 [Neisseria flavescens SK114]|nr:hypothetical protein NEIFL0001_0538 [Neisseria flavescens SK114]